MSTEPGETARPIADGRVARLFGLRGDRWLRHANPWSVWTRFAVLPLLAIAAWSRVWIGWWALVAALVVVAFTVVNPLLFPPPRSTRNWASKAVLGERVGADPAAHPVPGQYGTSRVPAVTAGCQTFGVVALALGVLWLDLLLAVTGLVLCQCAKAWYLDRAVLLFEDVKHRDPVVAAWEYGEDR
ncbi:DUF6653 family protein [Actinomycetospora straminea]|uniref:Uncharacterized protein n=1 Tax=Actinomycetospora straminea TaxID=663607 RepID=A0ABP9E370_9PSEU|nr:DUF6653 family protein [Actinomycetospora straminea]MDD7931146.1 hypothetical protein [Actinomycetospora straminea]